MAQRLDALGVAIDPQPVVVATGNRLLRNPAVAFDGAVWLVTWSELSLNGSAGSGNVFARRIGANGLPLDPAPILVVPGNAPDVAAVGGVFLVVATTNPSHFQSIHGARVRGADGAVLDPTPLPIGSYYSVDPTVTAFADRWLVAWQQHPSHDNSSSDVRATFVLPSGAPLGQLVVAASGRAPSATAGGSTAIVAWNDGSDVRARRIRSDGVVLDTLAGFVVSGAFNKQFTPAAGWDGTRWLVAWNDYRAHASLLDGGIGDVYGARVEADGTVTDPSGLAMASDVRVPECSPSIAGDLGVLIGAHAALEDAAPFGTFRIALTNLNGSGSLAPFCSGDGLDVDVTTGCPCNNFGATGRGCASSVNPAGALLEVHGAIDPDTIVLAASGMPATAGCIYLQGDALDDAVFGDGVRCAGGQLIRLRAKLNAGGASQFPDATDTVSVSTRGQVVPGSGVLRYYQTFYRNAAAAFCPPETFNVTNGFRITW
jgi:hypothetical protein